MLSSFARMLVRPSSSAAPLLVSSHRMLLCGSSAAFAAAAPAKKKTSKLQGAESLPLPPQDILDAWDPKTFPAHFKYGIRGNNLRKDRMIFYFLEILDKAKFMAIYQWTGAIHGDEWPVLRSKLKSQSFNMFILKNSIARKALSVTKYKNMHMLFNANTSIVYSHTHDLAALDSVMASLGPTAAKLTLLGVKVDGAILAKKDIPQYLALRPIQEYQAEIVGLLSAPPAVLVSTLEQNQQQLAHALATYVKASEEETQSKTGEAK